MTINPGYQRFHTPCYVLCVRAFHCNNHINSFSHLPCARVTCNMQIRFLLLKISSCKSIDIQFWIEWVDHRSLFQSHQTTGHLSTSLYILNNNRLEASELIFVCTGQQKKRLLHDEHCARGNINERAKRLLKEYLFCINRETTKSKCAKFHLWFTKEKTTKCVKNIIILCSEMWIFVKQLN